MQLKGLTFGKVLPIQILMIFLGILAVLASLSWANWSISGIRYLVNIAFLFVGSKVAFWVMQRLGLPVVKSLRIEHGAITGLIIFLLLDPTNQWWTWLVVGAGGEIIARLVRHKGGPILNPAGSTVLVASLFGLMPPWWGVSFAPRVSMGGHDLSVAAAITLFAAGYVAYRYRKLSQAIIFMAVFGVAYMLLFWSMPWFLLLEGTVLFFALVMTIEPKTTPIFFWDKNIFAVILGILTVVLMKVYFVEPFCGALVACNFGWWIVRKIREKK